MPFIQTHRGIRLTAKLARRDFVVRCCASPNEFTWEGTTAGWRDSADKVELLLGYEQGHQYLDAAGDQVVVQVSKGEYGSDWWSRHG